MTKKQIAKYEAAEQYLKQKGYKWELLNEELESNYIEGLYSLSKNGIIVEVPYTSTNVDLEEIDLLLNFEVEISAIDFNTYTDGFDWEYGSQFGTESWTAIEDIDASDAVALSDLKFWGEVSNELNYTEMITKFSATFKISEEEFKQDLEYFKLVAEYEAIQTVNYFYTENPEKLLD